MIPVKRCPLCNSSRKANRAQHEKRHRREAHQNLRPTAMLASFLVCSQGQGAEGMSTQRTRPGCPLRKWQSRPWPLRSLSLEMTLSISLTAAVCENIHGAHGVGLIDTQAAGSPYNLEINWGKKLPTGTTVLQAWNSFLNKDINFMKTGEWFWPYWSWLKPREIFKLTRTCIHTKDLEFRF